MNCVEYFAGGDRPYLVSGADDQTVKVHAPSPPGQLAHARHSPFYSSVASDAAYRTPTHVYTTSGVGLPDQAVCTDDGGPHSQCGRRLLPPGTPHHHVGIGGRHGPHLACQHVQARVQLQLRLRTLLVHRVFEGEQQRGTCLRRGMHGGRRCPPSALARPNPEI